MKKNSITNKITPCCSLPFGVVYWWVSNLNLNTEADRQFIISKISQSGTISIDAWKVLINSGTLEIDSALTKTEFLKWFECENQPSCNQLKLLIEGFEIGNWDYWLESIEQINEAFGELKLDLQLKYNDLANTTAEEITTLADVKSGVLINYKETTEYIDGSPMNDSKIDNVIYKKINDNYVERQFEGLPRLSWFNGDINKILTLFKEFIIDDFINLDGETITLTSDVLLFFEKGGFENGVIVGNGAKLMNLTENHFKNIDFIDSFNVNYISYKYFYEYFNDAKLLTSLFNLLFFSPEFCTLELESNKDYNFFDYPLSNWADATYRFNNISNKTIISNNTYINDTRPRVGLNGRFDSFLRLDNCRNINITLNYKNILTDYDLVTDLGYVGHCFIHLTNNCDNINIKSKTFGARYGVKCGDYSQWWLTGLNGITNSNFDIESEETGYPLAIDKGDNITYTIKSNKHHRMAYLTGVSNIRGTATGKNLYIGSAHTIISDCRYSDNPSEELFIGCSNVDVKCIDTGSTYVDNVLGSCCEIQQYFTDYGNRTDLVKFTNIKMSAIILEDSLITGFTMVMPETNTSPQNKADIYENVEINIFDNSTNQLRYDFRVQWNSYKKINNFKISSNAIGRNSLFDSASNDYLLITNSNINAILANGNLKTERLFSNLVRRFDSNIGIDYLNLDARFSQITTSSNPTESPTSYKTGVADSQANSTAVNISELVTDYNSLINKLKSSGLMIS